MPDLQSNTHEDVAAIIQQLEDKIEAIDAYLIKMLPKWGNKSKYASGKKLFWEGHIKLANNILDKIRNVDFPPNKATLLNEKRTIPTA